MKRDIILFLMIGLICMIAGCYEDKGSYDYKEVNEVVVDGLGDRYNVIFKKDTIRIDVYKRQGLDEVVVTGIYTRKKESFAGSSATYTAKELKAIGNTNVLQSLKTMDPSFAIIENNQYGSDPNRLPDINVRGKTSVIGLTQEYDTCLLYTSRCV